MLRHEPQKRISLSLDELRSLSEELELLEKSLAETRSEKERFLLFRKLKNKIKQMQAKASDN